MSFTWTPMDATFRETLRNRGIAITRELYECINDERGTVDFVLDTAEDRTGYPVHDYYEELHNRGLLSKGDYRSALELRRDFLEGLQRRYQTT